MHDEIFVCIIRTKINWKAKCCVLFDVLYVYIFMHVCVCMYACSYDMSKPNLVHESILGKASWLYGRWLQQPPMIYGRRLYNALKILHVPTMPLWDVFLSRIRLFTALDSSSCVLPIQRMSSAYETGWDSRNSMKCFETAFSIQTSAFRHCKNFESAFSSIDVLWCGSRRHVFQTSVKSKDKVSRKP